MRVLVCAASANTGGLAVRALSVAGGVTVRALFRKGAEDPRAAALAKLPGVTIVKGDLEDAASIRQALQGVDRAMLVSGAFTHKQFDNETTFIAAAAAAKVGVVRIATATGLMHPGSTGAYGRAHYCIEAYARFHDAPVVNLRPNWFFSNAFFQAGEAKAAGTISYPGNVAGGGTHMIDTRDVASAAALILLAPPSTFAEFVHASPIEVHGPEHVTFAAQGAALSAATGKPIKYQQVPYEAWIGTMVGYGMERVYATSFADTIRTMTADQKPYQPQPQKSSPLLLAHGWKPVWTLAKWANDDATKAQFV